MTTYRVVCTNQEPASQPPQHAHIVAIGVGTITGHYSQRFSLSQVIQMMDHGDRFYTLGLEVERLHGLKNTTAPIAGNII